MKHIFTAGAWDGSAGLVGFSASVCDDDGSVLVSTLGRFRSVAPVDGYAGEAKALQAAAMLMKLLGDNIAILHPTDERIAYTVGLVAANPSGTATKEIDGKTYTDYSGTGLWVRLREPAEPADPELCRAADENRRNANAQAGN